MKYYVKMYEWNDGLKQTAGVKARDDVDIILEEADYKAIEIKTQRKKADISFMQRIVNLAGSFLSWRSVEHILKKGDCLFIQFPLPERYLFLPNLVRKMKKRGVKVVALIHDLEMLRRNANPAIEGWKKKAIIRDEKQTLQNCAVVISHNKKMSSELCAMGIEKNHIIELGIFDYLTTKTKGRAENNKGIIVAGNLVEGKAGYVYKLPSAPEFNLYGPNYKPVTNQSNIHYYGSFEPDELINILIGKYGLVWDGDSTETCEGFFGNYLKYNNPHKVSLYLACGIPVIIWEEAALADFIKEEALGLTIKSIDEIEQVVSDVSEREYEKMKKRVNEYSSKLRSGYFTKSILEIIGDT